MQMLGKSIQNILILLIFDLILRKYIYFIFFVVYVYVERNEEKKIGDTKKKTNIISI